MVRRAVCRGAGLLGPTNGARADTPAGIHLATQRTARLRRGRRAHGRTQHYACSTCVRFRERVSRLVHQEVPQPPPALVDACQATTGGNPFLLSSLLTELRRHPVPDLDAYTTAIDTLAPRVVARSIRRRLAAAPDLWLRILQVTALLGDAADLTSVAELAEVEPEEVVPAVDAMVDLWLLRRDDAFRFRYPLERSTVYAEMPPAVRAQAHAHRGPDVGRPAGPGRVGGAAPGLHRTGRGPLGD